MADQLFGITQPQDFVIKILNEKRNGYYVELGAFHSTNGSNTNVLEKDLEWSGVSFDIVPKFVEEFNTNRSNPCILHDARKFDFLSYFKEKEFPEQIDFLQVDIEAGYGPDGRAVGGGADCLQGLIALPLNTHRFSVITFEHDTNMDFKNASIRDAQREILYSFGYALVGRFPHEDWWVDPNIIPMEEYKKFFVWDAP
jgi:hypothetical protein